MSNQIDTPSDGRKWRVRARMSSNRTGGFGVFAESFARVLGTPGFVLGMTVFVLAWVGVNIGLSLWLGPDNKFDPYPFILLNLAFSTQASYAAPLLMLAQNRQDDRDRVTAEQDRQRAERNLADTEFLAREIASLRLAVSEVATRSFVRSELRDLLEELDKRYPRLDEDGEADGPN